MLPLHHSHHENGDGRTRTGALSPDKRVLSPLSYAPQRDDRSGAGGIRTHGLELMRLARTATPLPRWENPRSDHRAVALRATAYAKRRVRSATTSLHSLKGLAGRSRTCGLRRPKPAGWPTPPQPDDEAPPAGLEPAASGLRARRHLPFDHGGEVKLRRQGSNLRLASNSRASYRSTTPERRRKGRESNPQGPRPTRFRDGLPRRWQPFRRWLRQESNLHPTD